MKKVFASVSDVCHAWAHQTQTEGRNGIGSIYFDGPTIYSYGSHFPIATIVDGTVFVTDRSYSITTTKHRYAVLSASSHLPRIHCDRPPLTRSNGEIDWYGWILDELITCETSVQRFLAKAASPKKLQKKTREGALLDAVSSVTRLRELVSPYLEHLDPKHLETINTRLTALDASVQDQDLQSLIDAAKAREAERLARIEADKQARLALFWEKVEEWRAGTLSRYDLPYTEGVPTLLRIFETPETTTVQTSKGITLTVDDTKTAIRLWKAGRLLGHKVNGYTCTRADSEGVTFGCHNIPASEIVLIEEALKDAH